eukprot:5133312-Pleurochrysis_carterae.AAC.1
MVTNLYALSHSVDKQDIERGTRVELAFTALVHMKTGAARLDVVVLFERPVGNGHNMIHSLCQSGKSVTHEWQHGRADGMPPPQNTTGAASSP